MPWLVSTCIIIEVNIARQSGLSARMIRHGTARATTGRIARFRKIWPRSATLPGGRSAGDGHLAEVL
jgi:hypothetical protein